MDKIYEYNGKYYSNTDHSEDIADDKWGGDLYDLYFDCAHNKDDRGILCEETYYYNAYNPEVQYADADELVEDFFEDCEVQLEDIKESEETE